MPGAIELNGKRVLVVGLARTGVATALFCAAHGATVTATDTRSEAVGRRATLRDAGVTLELGAHPEEPFCPIRTSSSRVPAFPRTRHCCARRVKEVSRYGAKSNWRTVFLTAGSLASPVRTAKPPPRRWSITF